MINDTHWYYLNGRNEVIGPVSLAGLRGIMLSGEISGETLICEEGTESWIPISGVIDDPYQSAKSISYLYTGNQYTESTSTTSRPKAQKKGNSLSEAITAFIAIIIVFPILFFILKAREEAMHTQQAQDRARNQLAKDAEVFKKERQSVVSDGAKTLWLIDKAERHGSEYEAEIAKQRSKEIERRTDALIQQHDKLEKRQKELEKQP